MATSIADLFVGLDLQGGEKVSSALKDILKTLKEISTQKTDINLGGGGNDTSGIALGLKEVVDALKSFSRQTKQAGQDYDELSRKLMSKGLGFNVDELKNLRSQSPEEFAELKKFAGKEAKQSGPASLKKIEELAAQLRSKDLGGIDAQELLKIQTENPEEFSQLKKFAGGKEAKQKVAGADISEANFFNLPEANQYDDKAEKLLKKNKYNTTQAKKETEGLFNTKPSDKLQKGLKGVGAGLEEVASMGFAAKAAILGALYGFEQMIAQSNKTATALTNFSALTGVSTQVVQQYEYAARQVGISSEEIQGTFAGLQEKMTQVHLGTGKPAGFELFAASMGVSAKDVEEYMKHPDLLMNKLQQYANKEKDIGKRNMVLESFVGKNVTAGMARNAFAPDVLKRAPVMSDREVKAVDQVAAMWRNLNWEIQRSIMGFNAAHGGQIANVFRMLVELGLKLADIILKIAEKFHLFEILGHLFDMVNKEANGVLDTVLELINSFDDFAAKNQLLEKVRDTFGFVLHVVKEIVPVVQALIEGIIKFAAQSRSLEGMRDVLSGIIDVIVKVITIIGKLATAFGVFDMIGNTLSATFSGLSGIIQSVSSFLDKLEGVIDIIKELDITKQIGSMVGNLTGTITNMLPDWMVNDEEKSKRKGGTPQIPQSILEPAAVPDSKQEEQTRKAIEDQVTLTTVPGGKEANGNVLFEPKGTVIAPYLKLIVPPGALPTTSSYVPQNLQKEVKNVNNNFNVDQAMHFNGEHKDPHATGNAVSAATNRALRQLSSQAPRQ